MTDLVICERQELVGVADAIRTKTGDSNTMTIGGMANAINQLSNAQDGEGVVVSDIVDEVNLKTGLSGTASSEQLVLDIASIATDVKDVTSYVRTEAERVASVVSALQNDNTISFVAMSDIHIGTDAQSQTSGKHLAQAVNIISDKTDIDFVASLGDIVTGAASDSLNTHTNNHLNALRFLSPANIDLRLVGNHDANSYNAASYLSAEDTHRRIGRYNVVATLPSSEVERGYCHYDLADKKLRIICLNTADLKDVSQSNAADGHHISAAQYSWLVSVLDMTGKSGWGVIVLSHHPVHWYGYMPNVLTILDAYVAGTSGSITVNGTSVSYNFAGKNVAKLIGTFHGHTHNLIHGKVGNAEIPRLGTPNGCFTRSNEYGSSSYGEDFRSKYGETTTYSKVSNNAKDTAFCVYTIDPDAKVIYATCYGAGYDRVVSYGDKAYFTITSNLTNVTIDNVAVSIESGTAYNANLSVRTNYTIQNVVVTMGGVDVTSNVYTDGVISIPEVTGNIIITASATGFTNLIDTIGYEQDMRLSTSAGTTKGSTGNVTTGYIDLTGFGAGETIIIRTKGVDFRASTNSNNAYAWYKNDKSFDNAGYLNVLNAQVIKTTFDDEGNMTCTITKQSTIGYIKFTGFGDGSNLIVTVNEQIINNGGASGGLIDGSKNIIDAVGYTNGYRLSTSTGNLSEASGYTTTNMIDLMAYEDGQYPVTVTVSGVSLDRATYSNCYVCLYDENGNWLSTGFGTEAGNLASTIGGTIKNNSDGSWSVTFNGTGTTYQPRYIKICAYGSGSNAVVTVTEAPPQVDQPTGYTNQIYTSIDSSGAVYNGGKGYKEGYRISTSSGNESSASGMTVTGFIPITATQVVRVKDIDLTSSNSTYGIYDSSFTKDSTGYCNTLFENADANGVRAYTATNSGYMRISGAFGSNPIITVNEEIL